MIRRRQRKQPGDKMEQKFKLVTANTMELFEERLNAFIGSLGLDDVVVDVKFQTSVLGHRVEYSALVQYQQTQGWSA